MSTAVIRHVACVGALVAGLLLGAGAGIATAEPDDRASDDGPGTSSDVENPSEGAGPGQTPDSGGEPGTGGPTSTIGNGRNDVADPTPTPATGRASAGGSTSIVRSPRKFGPSIRITLLRMPTIEEIRRPGLTPPSVFITTADIGLFTPFQDVWRAIAEPEPDPNPRPGPAFRTQQEEPPVIDATGNSVGGGERAAADETAPVLRAPVIPAARPPAPVATQPAPPALSTPPAAVAPAAGPQPATAGVRTPPIRGSLPPSGTIPLIRPGTPSTGQTVPAGYPRFLRGSSVGELAMVALPGLGGLALLTFSGGVIGYRQANSGRYVRTAAVARFLP